ncbi:isopenicillin N synthase-like dioxygenase [Kushneria sinocarnis]|uniref:2-oxoglutarate-dependent ethylene/succinate-forming enzyme n=1 Tax=Kushneria sinocarnis TaxID=595502 RepID=A0A420WUS8_9GAMM|nr:2OG-Fe(II) oxygenase family protein [Kushneria sinocarnis]RKQ97205.1 isopenicillin N synthase-like dioxygenase [Kushneria sinocarnis]
MQVQNVDYESAEAAQQFTRSLRETGFGVIRNHPVSQALVERIYRDWQQFFESDECLEWRFDPVTQDGYFPPDVSEKAKGQQLRDLKAYYHVFPWGKVPPELRPDIETYYQQVEQLAAQLLGWIEACTPDSVSGTFSESLSSMIRESQQTLLRILYYPALSGSEEAGAVRAAAHEDINLITVLPASNQAGLEVQDRSGEWLEVPCDPGQLVINVGDMLQEASGGYYPPTTHRVVNPTGEARRQPRLSLPLFLHPRSEVTLSSRYTAGQYLEERLRELGVL